MINGGKSPIAFIVKNSPIAKEEIKTFCIEKLAKYKIPKEIYFISEIPRNASKKILRRQLRTFVEESSNA